MGVDFKSRLIQEKIQYLRLMKIGPDQGATYCIISLMGPETTYSTIAVTIAAAATTTITITVLKVKG